MISTPPPPPTTTERTHSAADLAALMSAALGVEKAASVVASALVALHVEGNHIDRETARRVLEHLSKEGGLVGITGRVALSRFAFGAGSPSGVMGSVAPPGSTGGRASAATRPLSLVADLLAPTLGDERANTLVRETAETMKLGGELELDQALLLLEKITRMSGVVGVAARFAKTRIHLSW